MKRKKTGFRIFSLLVPIVILNLSSCSENLGDPDAPKLVIDLDDLETMYKQIVALSDSKICDDAAEWAFTAIGDKPCGGPAGYIAYSMQIDTVAFLAKVEAYTTAHKKYNIENGIISDCAIEPQPEGVVCHEEKAVLVYDSCDLSPDSGPCEAAIPKYYFDQETKSCKEFLWGGCDGVVPFETMEACQVCLSD